MTALPFGRAVFFANDLTSVSPLRACRNVCMYSNVSYTNLDVEKPASFCVAYKRQTEKAPRAQGTYMEK